MVYIGYALVGLTSGVLAGFVGVGGGLIIVPVLVLLFGYDQLKAQGTSLAVLLPPVGVLGFMQYWQNPDVKIDLWAAGTIAGMLMLGAYFGARLANFVIEPLIVRKIFAVVMIVAAVYMFFKR